MEVDLDLGKAGNESQGRMSKFKVKCQHYLAQAGLSVGNPISGHNILGHLCPILGYFPHI